MENKNKEVWKVKGEGEPVIEVWEDYYGNLWFTTEVEEDGNRFGFARLYNMPDCAEWGCFNIEYMKSELGQNMIWPVKKRDWGNINSYQDGLLMQVV